MKAIARAAFECEEKPPSPLARKIVTEIVVLAVARAIGRSINFFVMARQTQSNLRLVMNTQHPESSRHPPAAFR